jgi:hypothetical protein
MDSFAGHQCCNSGKQTHRALSSDSQVLINVSALSEARFRRSMQSGEVLCARSIEPFEGSRWRLRWMRAKGRSRSNGYGN